MQKSIKTRNKHKKILEKNGKINIRKAYTARKSIKNEKNAKRVAQWRENQSLTENVTHYERITLPLRNADKVKESKIKESKVKESKVK